MIDFVSFGIVIDDVVLPDGTTYAGLLGGGGPQTAWGMAAALGSGERVGLVGQVGADFDPDCLQPLRAAGINLDGVWQTVAPTPRAWQRIDAEGGRTHVWQVAPRQSITFGQSIDSVLPESYRDARGFHWGLHPENPALDSARVLTERGRRVCLETFKPPDQPLDDESLRDLLTSCHVFSPNWGEAAAITGSSEYDQVVARLRDCGCQVLALRRGAEGADVWDFISHQAVRVPSVPVNVVDPVGAGNAFCGALLAALDDGIAQAACHAVAAASYMIEQFGIPARLPESCGYGQRFAYARERLVELATA